MISFQPLPWSGTPSTKDDKLLFRLYFIIIFLNSLTFYPLTQLADSSHVQRHPGFISFVALPFSERVEPLCIRLMQGRHGIGSTGGDSYFVCAARVFITNVHSSSV